MSDPEGQLLQLRLQQDDVWPPFDCEEVRGQPVGDHRYRVLTPPAFAKRLAVDDIVTASPDATGRMWINAMVERGAHSTIRVILLQPGRESELTSALTAQGCRVGPSPLPGLLTVDVPESVDYAEVRSLLEAGERRGEWEFQESAVSLHHDLGTHAR
ncbi:MAG TPA: DUF4265 domain-containing protein [Micromonosporaceae bacterium]|nr:DUF4265 domain-containing protein [Micromonosporaceae bacterium]